MLSTITGEMGQRVLAAVEAKRYSEATGVLAQLTRIDCIDSPVVTRLLEQSKAAAMRKVEERALEASRKVMLGLFDKATTMIEEVRTAIYELPSLNLASAWKAIKDAEAFLASRRKELERMEEMRHAVEKAQAINKACVLALKDALSGARRRRHHRLHSRFIAIDTRSPNFFLSGRPAAARRTATSNGDRAYFGQRRARRTTDPLWNYAR